ncbi:MAG: hypothetical protein H7Y15_08505 [Pseudonocardia sp.]|nr:hypothetical protein [Pseudonocardia sp.]
MTISIDAPDWPALRAHRSRFWRPGMNTRFEPYVALAETNCGHVALPCGRNVEQAREMITRWRLLSEAGHVVNGAMTVGAAVIDPRGEIVEAWRLPEIGSVPDPGGSSRWSSLRQQGDWRPCLSCGAARWPGCYVAVDGTGCALCMPARETDDPRTWPAEPPASIEPPAPKKK